MTTSFIIVPRQPGTSCYKAPYTLLEVEYYVPGRFRVLRKHGEYYQWPDAQNARINYEKEQLGKLTKL